MAMAINNNMYARLMAKIYEELGPAAYHEPIRIALVTGETREFPCIHDVTTSDLSGDIVLEATVKGTTYLKDGDHWVSMLKCEACGATVTDMADHDRRVHDFSPTRSPEAQTLTPGAHRAAWLRERAMSYRDNRRDLIQTLRRVYTADELGVIFDRLVEVPEEAEPNATLTHFEAILAEAWTDASDAEHPF